MKRIYDAVLDRVFPNRRANREAAERLARLRRYIIESEKLKIRLLIEDLTDSQLGRMGEARDEAGGGA